MLKTLILFFPIFLQAQSPKTSIKVLSFNTMCDWCTKPKKDFHAFEKRFSLIKKFLADVEMDFYSLQEIRTSNQVHQIIQKLGENYRPIHFAWGPFNYPDPTIIYNSQKFKLLSRQFKWLGPREGNFSFGWNWAIPRLMLIAQFISKEDKIKFYLISAHFDNLDANRAGAVEMLTNFVKNHADDLIIVALDSNTRVFDPEYLPLKKTFINSFNQTPQTFQQIPGKKLCYKHKGKKFPKCMVDHILFYDPKNKLKTLDWTIYSGQYEKKFLSDHRAISAELEIKGN